MGYCHRSCSEVLSGFRRLVSATDFVKETSSLPSLQIDPAKSLVFVAYFVTESDLAAPGKSSHGTMSDIGILRQPRILSGSLKRSAILGTDRAITSGLPVIRPGSVRTRCGSVHTLARG